MILDGARDAAVGFGYSAGWGLVKAVPHAMSARAFRSAADAATVRNGRGTQQLRKNLRRVVGPGMSELRMDALVGDALRSYSRYWLETFRFRGLDAEVVADVERNCRGSEHIDAALERGKGVILALPHSGNWDASGMWAVDRYGPFTTVAERLRPESVFDKFVAYREAIGMEVVALTGGERPPTQVLAERLRQNRLVCLLADRDLSHGGIEVDFFGESAKMPPGPALLAATTGATLLGVHAFFVGDRGWGHTISAPIELGEGRLRDRVTRGTQAVADFFAVHVAQAPADWHMLQRLWLADLRPAQG